MRFLAWARGLRLPKIQLITIFRGAFVVVQMSLTNSSYSRVLLEKPLYMDTSEPAVCRFSGNNACSDTLSSFDNSFFTSLPGSIPESVVHNTIFNVLGARFVNPNK